MNNLTFITPLAYDYKYAFSSISSYYSIADEIILGLDVDRKSWSGHDFYLNINEINDFIKKIDVENKIQIVEKNFHNYNTPMQNDTSERSYLSNLAKKDNWKIQIDSDEIVLNPFQFKEWLIENNPVDKCVYGLWLTVFKIFGNKALIVHPQNEYTPVATKLPSNYLHARITGQEMIKSPLQLLHFSWGRSPIQVKQKLTNWGHAVDFDISSFYRIWEETTLDNYHKLFNFHPLNRTTWQSLRLLELDIDEAYLHYIYD
jgi:hypothetical protein